MGDLCKIHPASSVRFAAFRRIEALSVLLEHSPSPGVLGCLGGWRLPGQAMEAMEAMGHAVSFPWFSHQKW